MAFLFFVDYLYSMEGIDALVRGIFNVSTYMAVVILILCVLIENAFPDVFKDNDKKKRIRISIDPSDWRHCLFLLTAIGVVLFTPVLNFAIPIMYSLFVLYKIYRYYRK